MLYNGFRQKKFWGVKKMMSKILEERVELDPSVDVYSELVKPIFLEYYLVESDAHGSEYGLMSSKVYGIEIVKKESDSSNARIESELVRNVSCCRESARMILNKLAINSVTPVGLPFILDDLLGA